MPDAEVAVNGQGSASVEKKPAVNKPSDSLLKQQKLKAWQPILTAGTVLPVFYVIGVIFIPIGAALLVASNNVFEYSFDYTDCVNYDDGQFCKNSTDSYCECRHTFKIDQTVPGPVYVYYGLSNFYQNHRRYVKSRDDQQLLGDLSSVSGDCSPFDYVNETGVRKMIVPCGAIANSMFNDTFYLRQLKSYGSEINRTMEFSFKGIAWPSDVAAKFKNPSTPIDYKVFAKPKSWSKRIDEFPGQFQNESFIVWMRISALPTFRKLYAIMGDLQPGNYSMEIVYNYPVDVFEGRKRFILSTTSWAGGRNPFLGIAYIIVGSLCVLTGTVFFFIHMKYGKTLTEMANVHR